jgi:aminodeoxyfutalosine synthase
MSRISEQEALDLFLNAPLDELCARANAEKEAHHSKSVYWVNNRQINYTNVCVLHCKFCAFSRIKKDSPTAYDWNYETIRDKAASFVYRLSSFVYHLSSKLNIFTACLAFQNKKHSICF